MCFGGQATTGTSTSAPPQWVQDAGKGVLGKANDYYSQPYQAYSGSRVAGTSGDTSTGFEMLRKMLDTPDSTGDATAMAKAGAGSAAPGMADYMNPFLDQVLGTAKRNINETADQQRKRLDATAHMSGAFGDARQGVMQGEANQRTEKAIGDVTGSIGSDAFKTALGASQADLARLGGGASNLMGVQASGQNSLLQRITAMLTGGKMQEGKEQAGLDAAFGAFQDKKQDPMDKLKMLFQALNSASGTGGSTKTDTAPDNSGFQALGGIAQAVLGIPAVAAML